MDLITKFKEDKIDLKVDNGIFTITHNNKEIKLSQEHIEDMLYQTLKSQILILTQTL